MEASDRARLEIGKRITEEVRPWGKFRSYPHRSTGSLKIITVRPGRALSLQYHHRRSEFWVVLDSGLEMTLGRRVWRPRRGEEIFIPCRTPHRLRCVGRRPGRVMELWIGRSNEADIVRLKDDFGRAT
ncbi:MAG: mannose-6-phosphate isomerase [Candidatus Aminicenantes bacterium RBG_13_59_9]|nr:MAG: mannose-6-phosphate isomerase [Candidatus Aminicenantes bacterium RBG_13_59_9]